MAPSGVVSTGWPAVRDKCADLGIRFRWWQDPIGQLILAKRVDGKYAATIGGTGLSIPRQVGKTYLVGAIVFALCLLRPNLTVIWTAHRVRTSEETFKKMQAFTRRTKIRPHIAKVLLGSGEESIEFANGSRILFGARERGFGRGFDEVDVLIYDEAQILTEAALDAQIPATNQSRQDTGALLLFMGTPPKPSDPGEVFTRMRDEALSGEDHDTGWVELGADPGYVPTPAPLPLTDEDWAQVAKANPSYPQDTPAESILRMRKKLGPASFIREALGDWAVQRTDEIIPTDVFAALRADVGERPEQLTYSLEVPLGRPSAVVGAGWLVAGKPHVEIAHAAEGTGWVVEWLIAATTKRPGVVHIDGAGEAASFIPDLERAGVKVEKITGAQRAQACGSFYDLATTDGLTHDGNPDLAAALAAAAWKVSTEGTRTFSRRSSGGDISHLYAAAFAAFGAAAPPREFWGAIG